MTVFRERVEPNLDDYMGWSIFEDVCAQWLRTHSRSSLGLSIRTLGRYWSRDGRTEIDIVADLEGGRKLFGECQWSAGSQVDVGVYSRLRAKVEALPNNDWKEDAQYVLFSLGGFTGELVALSKSGNHVHLIDGEMLFSGRDS